MKKHQVTYNNKNLTFFDALNNSTEWIIDEIYTRDVYNFKKMKFAPQDIIIDIGANIGMFSIYLAKCNPLIKIYAFEPFPTSFEYLCMNIKENQIQNIIPIPLAITSDRRRMYLYATNDNLGGANNYVYKPNTSYNVAEVSSLTLNDVFKMFDFSSIKMLKIDCEGGEFEIIPNFDRLKDVEYLVGEFHYLYGERDPLPLLEYCKTYFTEDKLQITCF